MPIVKVKIMKLTATYEKKIPFRDIDSLGVLWHGNYVAYMEEAREAFLAQYDLTKIQLGVGDYILPVTHVDIHYKGAFVYGDAMLIEVEYLPCKRSRVDIAYRFYRKSDRFLMTEAVTSHHFFNPKTREVAVNRPDFYKEWQEQWKVFDAD